MDNILSAQAAVSEVLSSLPQPALRPLVLDQLQPRDPATIDDPGLRLCYETLLALLPGRSELVLDSQRWQIVVVPSAYGSLRHQVEAIIDYAYQARYTRTTPSTYHTAPGFLDTLPATTRLAVCQQLGEHQIVLATMRCVAGPLLETFEFFEPLPDTCWPHLVAGAEQKPGEFGKLALHPLFDRHPAYPDELTALIQLYRLVLVRLIWQACLQTLAQQEVDLVYGIHAAHVARFLATAGLVFEPLDHVVLRDTPYTRSIYETYQRYWRTQEQAEQRPALHIYPWHLQEATWEINGERWTTAPIQIDLQRSAASNR